jgi:hypothetical protein
MEWPAAAFAQGHPGIKATIIGVAIPSHRRPVVTFKIADSKGQPLEQSDLDEDGIRFTVATIKVGANGETHYHNYILSKVTGKDYVYKGETKKPVLEEALQPGFDQGGVLTRLGPGTLTYTFKTALPANYERNGTQVVGGELTRGKAKYVANPLYEFVPSGDKIRILRTVVETATCNNCHDPLKYHGDTRREAGYCALCHTSQLTDLESGENLEFKIFHASATGQRDNWKQFPSTAACTACHDDVDLRTGKNHLAGPQVEGTCVGCHMPEGPEFGPSIAGAHTFPGWSTQLPGIVFDILKIEGTNPGQNPVVTFSVKTKKGEPMNAAQMDNMRLVVAWPTVDYKIAVEEDVRKAESQGNGIYTHKFKYRIPAEATGSGAIWHPGIQKRRAKEAQRQHHQKCQGRGVQRGPVFSHHGSGDGTKKESGEDRELQRLSRDSRHAWRGATQHRVLRHVS